MFHQTTKRFWLHSTSFASKTSSSQRSSKTSQASASTHQVIIAHLTVKKRPSACDLCISPCTISSQLFGWAQVPQHLQLCEHRGSFVMYYLCFSYNFFFIFWLLFSELGFCIFKPSLSVVLVGFIPGSLLFGWFLVDNQFIIKCFEKMAFERTTGRSVNM